MMTSCVKAFADTRACIARTDDAEFDVLYNRGVSKGRTLFKDVYLISQLLNNYLNPHKRLCVKPNDNVGNEGSSDHAGGKIQVGPTALLETINMHMKENRETKEIPLHEMETIKENLSGDGPISENYLIRYMKKLSLIKTTNDLKIVSQLFSACGKSAMPCMRPLYNKVPFLSLGNFLIFYRINEGSSGKVYVGFHRLHRRTYAVKVISKSQFNGDRCLFKRLKDEMTLATEISHPNIVRTFELIETNSSLIIAMEYCDGGDLIGLIKDWSPMKESMARTVFRMIVSGINYLHQLGICHRDIKPENILLKRLHANASCEGVNMSKAALGTENVNGHTPLKNSNVKGHQEMQRKMQTEYNGTGINTAECKGDKDLYYPPDISRKVENTNRQAQPRIIPYTVKIGDFGAATKIVSAGSLVDTVGTMSYAAPEVLGCGGVIGYCGKKADVWSLGVLLYAMLFGELPWHNEKATLRDAVSNIISKAPSFPSSISQSAKEIINGMLIVNPIRRLTITEIMEHPWFLEGPIEPALTIKKIRPALSNSVQ